MRDALAGGPAQNFRDHRLGETAAPGRGVDCDLPDEKMIGLAGDDVSGSPARDAAPNFGDNAGLREVAALQQVAIERILVERRTGGDKVVDGGPV